MKFLDLKRVNLLFVTKLIFYAIFVFFLWIYFIASFCCSKADLISSIPSEFWFSGFIVMAVLLRDKILFVLSLIYFVFANINPPVHLQKIHIPEYVPLKVCSYNSRFFFAQDRENAISTLANLNCDVYVIQEVWHSEEIYQQLIDSYMQKYFKNFNSVNWAEFWIMFKNDIQLKRQFKPKHEGFLALTLTVNRFNRKYEFNLINIHIWNPLVTRNTLSFVEMALGQQSVQQLPPYLVRKAQIDDLYTFLDGKSVTNFVILGDFNTLPSHALIWRKIWTSANVKEHISKVSPGLFYATYPSALPFLAIDHAFVGDSILVEEVYTKDLGLSDHKALILKVGIPAEGRNVVAWKY